MKNHINIIIGGLIAVSAFTGVSCQRNLGPEVIKDGDGAIVFRVDDRMSLTKAISVTEGSTIQGSSDGFKVAALKATSGSVLFNENAKYDSGKSAYLTSTPYYFPSGSGAENVSFYAVYPAKTLTVSSGAVSISNYTSNGTEDLVACVRKNVASQSNAVALTFDHILSGLTVKCYGTDSSVDYEVTAMEVTYNEKGTYSYADSTLLGTWGSFTTGKKTVSTATSVATAAASATTLVSETAVLPGEVKVKISWKCYTKDSSKTLVGTYSDVTKTTTLSIGKQSVVTCKLGNSSAEGMSFSVSVNSWGDPVSQSLEFDS